MRPRSAVQTVSAILGNLYLEGWLKGAVYAGGSKAFCFPGLHCYSCPSSVLACPVGALQSILAAPGFAPGLMAGERGSLTLLAVLGFLLAIGFLAGRAPCAWLCPFGFLQDLLARLRRRHAPIPEAWGAARFAVLAVFVIALPLALRPFPGAGGDPWFCKAVCPAGTMEAGWPLMAFDGGATLQPGFLFAWKSALAVAILAWSVASRRPFCRVLCPLGALWSLAGRFSLRRMSVSDRCVSCGRCRTVCPVEHEIWRRPRSQDCIRCGQCVPACPAGAISEGWRSTG